MSETFYTSDLHFGHANIISYTGRPFTTTDQMNTALVEVWNSTVSAEDTVYVLGDVALGKLEESLTHINLLAGRKILIPGNHDSCWLGDRRYAKGEPDVRAARLAKARQLYLDAGFAQVVDDPAPVRIGGQRVELSHFPYRDDSRDVERHLAYRPTDHGQWLVHGHVHGTWRQRGRMINVGVDVWAGVPVSTDQLAELIADGPRDLDRVAWATA